MIRLANSGSVIVYESGTFEHPLQGGGSYVEYNLNHNKGSAPDLTCLYTNDYTGAWVEWFDISGVYGFAVNVGTSNYNTQVIDVYRLDASSNTIKFKLVWFTL